MRITQLKVSNPPTTLPRLLMGLITLLALGAAGPNEPSRALPFSGRLLDDQAHAVVGPVDLQVILFRSEADLEPIKTAPMLFPKTELADGVFRVQIVLTEIEVAGLGLGTNPTVYLQVKDISHDRIYQRQKFSLAPPEPVAAPAAAPAPEANGSTQGRAELVRAASAACLASQGAGAKFVLYRSGTADQPVPCANACAAAKPGAGCIRGWTLFAGDEYMEFGSECSSVPVLAGTATTAHLCCCLVTTGATPLTIGVPAGIGP